MKQTIELDIDLSVILAEVQELKQMVRENRVNEKLVYTTKELTELLGYKTQTNRVDQLRRLGAIKAFKRGLGYSFTRDSVLEFLQKYDGKDLSNPEAIERSVLEVTTGINLFKGNKYADREK